MNTKQKRSRTVKQNKNYHVALFDGLKWRTVHISDRGSVVMSKPMTYKDARKKVSRNKDNQKSDIFKKWIGTSISKKEFRNGLIKKTDGEYVFDKIRKTKKRRKEIDIAASRFGEMEDVEKIYWFEQAKRLGYRLESFTEDAGKKAETPYIKRYHGKRYSHITKQKEDRFLPFQVTFGMKSSAHFYMSKDGFATLLKELKIFATLSSRMILTIKYGDDIYSGTVYSKKILTKEKFEAECAYILRYSGERHVTRKEVSFKFTAV